jgi:nesprin-1
MQNRLLESLSKFQEYEDTVESIKRNLDALEPQISKEVDIHASSLPESQQQIERVRVRG